MLNDREPIISFQMPHDPEKNWTTSQIFEYFNVSNDKNITDSGQILDGIMIIYIFMNMDLVIHIK
jgi:hypothetical protein